MFFTRVVHADAKGRPARADLKDRIDRIQAPLLVAPCSSLVRLGFRTAADSFRIWSRLTECYRGTFLGPLLLSSSAF